MRRIMSLVVGLGTSLLCFQGCYGATEVLVSVQTDVPCATVRTTGISVRATGASASVGDAAVLATSVICTDGAAGQPNDVGTLVFVPDADTPQIAIRVVLGVTRSTESCDPVTSAGCITADRRITYEKHRTLRLPIRLDDACTGRVCGQGQTCSSGKCVSSVASCTGASCEATVSDDASAPPVVTVDPDAGGVVVDAGPIVLLDAATCPPRPRAAECGCKDPTPYCCYAPTAATMCYASLDACERAGGTPPCTDDCQCAGKQCLSSSQCGLPGGLVKVCGGSCVQNE